MIQHPLDSMQAPTMLRMTNRPSLSAAPPQAGGGTHTFLHHFLIAGPAELHDLHPKLELNHPSGEAMQLYNCIVAHSTGKGIFDGSVKV